MSNGRGAALSLATVWKFWGMTAQGCVGRLAVGVELAPNLVAQVIGEDYGISKFEACLPDNGKGITPCVTYRERVEPDA